jgi:selenocysteine lyase/cysteine desulfurase
MSGDDGKIVYLNNAAMARLHPDVKKAGIQAITDPMHHDNTVATSIRMHFATLIEASSDTIAIMPSTAFAVTLAAKNLEQQLVGPGKILVLQDQMCSAVYPWQDVCDRSNGKLTLDIVPYPDNTTTWTDLVLERLQTGTVVAACLPPLHWADGALLDLDAIGEACRSRDGIPLIVDATQAVGAMPLSVQQIRPALLACSIHKWLRGPSGASLVYIDPALHDRWAPLDQHGRGRDLGGDDWDASKDEMGPSGYPEQFLKDARKFDSGGKPNPILLPMLRSSLEHVVTLDQTELQQTLRDLMQPLLKWVHLSGKFSLPASHPNHLVGIRPVNMTPDQMIGFCNRLQSEKGIYLAVRCGAFRISPYLDNTKSDIEALLAAFLEMTS